MATRREIREWAIQLLFELDMNAVELDQAFAHFWDSREADEEARLYAERLVRGVQEHRERIDAVIIEHAENWALARMAVVDRNVMRLALYEMLFCDDVPPVVSINEAVDLAKYFNSSESGKFVNGILDRVCRELDRPARTAAENSK